jgi:hypothetical protein
MLPGRAAGRKSLIIKHLHKTTFTKRAKSAKTAQKLQKKIFTESQKNRLRSAQMVLP